MIRRLWIAGVLALLLFPPKLVANQVSLGFLEGVKAFSNTDELRVLARFRDLPSTVSLSSSEAVFKERSVSLVVPQMTLFPERRVFYLGDGQVDRLEARQITPTAVELRFVLSADQAVSPNSLEIARQGDEVVFQFHRQAVGPVLSNGKGNPSSLVTPEVAARAGPEDTAVQSVLSAESLPRPVTVSSRDLSGPDSPLLPASAEGQAPADRSAASDPPVAQDRQPLVPASNDARLSRAALRMAASLGVVVGILILAAMGTRKLLNKRGGWKGKERLIRVLSSSYLGPKKSLSLVEVAGERLVLGVSQNKIAMLARLSEQPHDLEEKPISASYPQRGSSAERGSSARSDAVDENSLTRMAQAIQDRVSRLKPLHDR